MGNKLRGSDKGKSTISALGKKRKEKVNAKKHTKLAANSNEMIQTEEKKRSHNTVLFFSAQQYPPPSPHLFFSFFLEFHLT